MTVPKAMHRMHAHLQTWELMVSVFTLGRLGRLGGLAVGPLGRPAASPGFTLLGRSSLDTPDPGRSKASSPTFINPRGLFLTAFSAAPFTSGLPASAPGNCSATHFVWVQQLPQA